MAMYRAMFLSPKDHNVRFGAAFSAASFWFSFEGHLTRWFLPFPIQYEDLESILTKFGREM